MILRQETKPISYVFTRNFIKSWLTIDTEYIWYILCHRFFGIYLRQLIIKPYFKALSKASDDSTTTQLKQPLVRTLSPISSSKHPSVHHDQLKYRITPNESTSQNITPSFLINSTENVAKPKRSTQVYNWKPRPPNDLTASSPSLVRPTLTTPPKTRKNMQYNAMSYSYRMKEDKLFDAQRWEETEPKLDKINAKINIFKSNHSDST